MYVFDLCTQSKSLTVLSDVDIKKHLNVLKSLQLTAVWFRDKPEDDIFNSWLNIFLIHFFLYKEIYKSSNKLK